MGKIELDGKKAFAALPQGVSKAEIEAERKETVSVSISGEAMGLNASSVTTLYARVGGEVSGTACSQALGQDLSQLLEKARDNGRWAGGRALPFAKPLQKTFSDGRRPQNPEALRELAAALEKAVRAVSQGIVSASAAVSEESTSIRLLSADGADLQSENRAIVAEITAEADWDGFACGSELTLTGGSPEDFCPEKMAAALAEQLRLQQRPGSFTPGSYRVLLDQPVVWNLMLTAWQVFSGPRCAAKTSCFHQMLGKQVGSSCLGVADYPSHPQTGFRYDFDFEGSPCQPVALVKQGRMAGMLHHLDSAAAFGALSNGRAGRAPLLTSGIPNAYTVTPRIFIVEPGQAKAEMLPELLGDGLRITESYDPFHCLDIASGHFSIPCRGILYKNGKPAGSVASIAIHVDLSELFQAIELVVDDLRIAPFLMTHAYCVGAPSLLVSRLVVSGK